MPCPDNSVKRTSNHSEQRLFREEVLSFTREICVCAHLTQTRDALEKCAEMGINMKIQIQKRKLAVSSILSFILTFLQIAGWQLSMNYGSSMHRSVLLQRIGVLKVWQCLLWGILEWILLDVFSLVLLSRI